MPSYRFRDTPDRADDIFVIEDDSMVSMDGQGGKWPTYAFVDSHTIKAHAEIIDILMLGAEPLWNLDQVFEVLFRRQVR